LLLRLCGTLFMVLSTYNPTGWSFVHWVRSDFPGQWLLQLPCLTFYALGYILLFRAMFRSLRLGGIGMTVALEGTLVWVLADAGLVTLDSAGDLATVALYMLGGLFAVGMSWIPIWTGLTGQVSVDNLNA
jgi:hypothetical protein